MLLHKYVMVLASTGDGRNSWDNGISCKIHHTLIFSSLHFQIYKRNPIFANPYKYFPTILSESFIQLLLTP